MENKNRRRHYFIERDFQTKFIIKFCLLIITTCALLSVLVYALSQQTVTTAFENSRLVIKSTADYIIPILLLSSTVSAILICLATIVIVLFISHKIVGPVYRFQRSVKAIADGHLDFSIRIRDKDQLQPLANALDEMLNSLRGSIVELKKNIALLKQEAAKLSEANKLQLEEKIKRIEQEISFFKT